MGFKEKLSQHYTNSYLAKYGDRLTQAQGKVISIKTEQKSFLFFHKLIVTILIKPDRSKNITKCVYKKNKWFKKPTFMAVSQGHSLLIQGLKGKKGKNDREILQILNIINMTNKSQLVPVEGDAVKKVQQAQKVKYR
ncbi:hypothetical protein IRP63_07625 [Clostridium botulinum]|uniref:Uncharacterized protein n=1 Tax=Clostridium botulinum C/D str. DC5 TaxID=1443128 RepID=A0A0A0IK87_CLOBO|nr:hypothetical protein [Clostridium botulinum]KEI02102.1 hypothetical protein Z952_09565 [Clostridium botulinum C/D str. BKT75002]KEI09474.1 hypothetical protein Z954_12505 [Clostridium botulinum C/D str. BKT2873]KGM96638.1 hypothetical protein Z956_02770 [Clostridium botulinum D str. CCUG 7971]KGN01880.1 hypothetical protein Z955_00330 [Clostridium botulinum C/D str. DC5]KOC48516.1 hypothetical protein ADU88_07865 [Clostridium botulinum]